MTRARPSIKIGGVINPDPEGKEVNRMKKLAKLTCGLIVLNGTLVGLSGIAAADASPEITYPDAATCLFLFNTPGYAGNVAGALRSPAQGPPDTILICRLHAQEHL